MIASNVPFRLCGVMLLLCRVSKASSFKRGRTTVGAPCMNAADGRDRPSLIQASKQSEGRARVST